MDLQSSDNRTDQVDAGELRKAFGTFATGVTIVTTRDGSGKPRGMTANSFSSVSLDPPLVLVCVAKSALSSSAFESSLSFAVNVLHEGQKELSTLFASKSPDKFKDLKFKTAHTGSPVLADSLSWFDCSTYSRIDAGDHYVLIGQVHSFGTRAAPPLGFFRGRYVRVPDADTPANPPARVMVTSYIVEMEQQILLRSMGDGLYGLPILKAGSSHELLVLSGGWEIKIDPERAFLYSVFDAPDAGFGHIVHRVSLQPGCCPADLAPELKFFPIHALPLNQLDNADTNAILRRYVRERSEERYGIFVGQTNSGRIAMIDNFLQTTPQGS